MTGLLRAGRIETGCLIDIEQTPEAFHAYALMDNDVTIRAGDRVTIHGAPIQVHFGARFSEHRRATIERAGLLRRVWTRLTAGLELNELYEVTFTPGRLS